MISINFADIVNNGLLPAVLVLILTGIIKLYFDSRLKDYEKKIDEKYKEKDREFSLIIENHKKELDLVYFKSSKLHDKRLDIISELYGKLVDLEFAMRYLTSKVKLVTGDTEKDYNEEIRQGKVAANLYDEYYVFYSKHRIFFSIDICALMDKIRDEYLDSLFSYTYDKKNPHSNSHNQFYYDLKISATNKVFEEIPKLKEQIESEFREIINVNTPEKN